MDGPESPRPGRRRRGDGRRALRYDAFERRAREVFEDIPEAYRRGVDGLVVSREARAHPDHPDVFTLGECLTEDWPSEWQGPETVRSVVVLYWGSFRNLSRTDPDFDWEEELGETLTHELRHHLEWLAGEAALEGVDYAMDQEFLRRDGQEFDPWYYQSAEDQGGGRYRMETHVFIEQEWSAEAFAAAREISFRWAGEEWSVPRPDELGDIHYVWVEGATPPPDTLELVLVRRRSWWEDVKRLAGVSRPEVLESEGRAERKGP